MSDSTRSSRNQASEIQSLKAQIADLERQLLRTEVRLDVVEELSRRKDAYIAELEQQVAELDTRNKHLENPSNVRYQNLSWQQKVIFCIRKSDRPMRAQEIAEELRMMGRLIEGTKDQSDGFLSVVLARAVKNGQLHIEKLRGTRGAFYALTEWLVNGELPEDLKREMW